MGLAEVDVNRSYAKQLVDKSRWANKIVSISREHDARRRWILFFHRETFPKSFGRVHFRARPEYSPTPSPSPLQLQGLPLSRLEEANGSEIPKGRRGEKRSGRKFVVGKGGKKGREGGRKEEIKKKRKGKREGKEGGAH